MILFLRARRRRLVRLLLTSTLLFPTGAAGGASAGEPSTNGSGPWQGPDGPLPFETEAQLKDFLRTARIVSQKEITSGVNRPLKVRLRQDGVEANGIFRIVDIERKRARLDGKLMADFHDSYVYECAAYEVSRILGIDHVPPCVRRQYERIDGSMQLWVEDALTEKGRREAGKEPPQQILWARQKQTMHLFDALIYNFDRNQGNMLITPDWKLWFIDHTRSFRKSAVVERLDKLIWCERAVWERLRALEKRTLSRQLKSLVSPLRINMLLKRRDKLVDHFRARIDRLGEEAVLYDASDVEVSPAGLIEIPDDNDIPETSSKLEEPDRR